METVHQTNEKDPSTITLSNTETCSTNTLLSGLEAELSNLNSIFSTTHSGNHPTPPGGPFI